MALAESNYNDSMQVTYVEIRWWARYLRVFTASDLADAMGVDLSVGERGIKALLWHGIVDDTGEEIDGPGGSEQVVEYAPLPPGPKTHETPHTPPPWMLPPELASHRIHTPRGMPVRLVDNTDRRNQMQGTGGARIRIKQRDKAYERMMEAKAKQAEKNRAKEREKHEGPKRKRDESLPT